MNGDNVPSLNSMLLRSRQASQRAAIWAFVGTLYGLLFLVTFALADYYQPGPPPILIAGTLSGCIAALIYSSMSLAAIVTPISSIAALATVMSAEQTVKIGTLLLVAAIVGLVIGAIYGALVKGSRVYRAEAKTIAGTLAGFVVAAASHALSLAFPGIPIALVVALMCLSTGALYILFAIWCVPRFHALLPPIAGGALAGAGTSMFIAATLLLMITKVTPEVADNLLQPLLADIHSLMPATIFGGMLGGAISGFVKGMMRAKWYDL